MSKIKKVIIRTLDGLEETTCHYTVGHGYYGVTKPCDKDQGWSKWAVTHLPTGLLVNTHYPLNNMEEAIEYARKVNQIIGRVPDPCLVKESQTEALNRCLGRRLFKPWRASDPGAPCGHSGGGADERK